MAGFRFRLLDTAGSELAIVPYSVPRVREGETVHLPDGRGVTVLEVYDDGERGQDGGVQATLVVDAYPALAAVPMRWPNWVACSSTA
jgi:hypothetical protein